MLQKMPTIFKKTRRVLDPEISYKIQGPKQNKLIAFEKTPLFKLWLELIILLKNINSYLTLS